MVLLHLASIAGLFFINIQCLDSIGDTGLNQKEATFLCGGYWLPQMALAVALKTISSKDTTLYLWGGQLQNLAFKCWKDHGKV